MITQQFIDYLNYLLPFDQRFANMTSFNDFREGDIMNIYHNGSEIDGLKGKFLETSGNHCATTTEHFQDALNFVEHPFLTVIDESFDGNPMDIPFELEQATQSNEGNLQMEHSTHDFAQIKSQDIFLWNDPKGAILQTAVQLNPDDFNSNTKFHLGIWSMENSNNYCGLMGNQLDSQIPTILLTIDFLDVQPTLTVQVENPSQPAINDILFTATFSDWDVNQTLAIKYHLWDKELRVELGAHLATPSVVATGVLLLDDMRSIRIRWDEVANGFWNSASWEAGAFLTMATEKDNVSLAASNLFVQDVELITADLNIETTIPDCSALSVEWIDFTATVTTDKQVMLAWKPISEIDKTVFFIERSADKQQWEVMQEVASIENSTKYWVIDPIPFIGQSYYRLKQTDGNGGASYSTIQTVFVESTLEDKLLLFPNPMQDNLHIFGKGIHLEDIQLFDLVGRNVSEMISIRRVADGYFVMDVSYLPVGLYYLKMKTEVRAVYK